jgi:hypothetical protein
MEQDLGNELSSRLRWKLLALALGGTLLIGSVPVVASRSETTHAAFRLVGQKPQPQPVARIPRTPPEHAGQISVAAPQSSNQTPSATRGSEQPMYQSGANVSIVSTVTTGAGEVQITGTATPGTRVTVNGAPVAVDSDGTWSVKVSVDRTPMTVDVVAVSADGSNRSSSSVTVGG